MNQKKPRNYTKTKSLNLSFSEKISDYETLLHTMVHFCILKHHQVVASTLASTISLPKQTRKTEPARGKGKENVLSNI
jgi:hypothetical protein